MTQQRRFVCDEWWTECERDGNWVNGINNMVLCTFVFHCTVYGVERFRKTVEKGSLNKQRKKKKTHFTMPKKIFEL